MSKPFSEVFPSVKTEKDLSIFKDCNIMRITRSSDGKWMCIYLHADYLIEKKYIYALEKAIKKELIKTGDINIRIREEFKLSDAYNAKNLTDMYLQSILLELKEYDHILERMLYSATIECIDDNTISITVDDTVVYRSKEKELIEILEKIYTQRCHVDAVFDMHYREAKRSERSVFAEEKARSEAMVIAEGVKKNVEAASRKTEASSDNADNGVAKDKKKSDFKRAEGSKFEGRKSTVYKKSDNPDVIYGRDFDDEAMEISDINAEIGEVCIKGKIIFTDSREIKNEKTILMFDITDYTDTIRTKIFVRNEMLSEVSGRIKNGANVKLKGMALFDRFDHEVSISSVVGVKEIPEFTQKRMDNHPKKRVELHCHTKMSDMDGVSEVGDIIKRAKSWGHSSIAITDHGVVQAFTEGFHKVGYSDPFKLIYGTEGYLVNDESQLAFRPQGLKFDGSFVAFDIETTGFSPIKDTIIEIGAVKIVNGEITDTFNELINPLRPIPYRIEELTGINDSMVKDKDTLLEVLPRFLDFAGDLPLIAHNATFDTSFIAAKAKELGLDGIRPYIDTLGMARYMLSDLKNHKLDTVCKALNIVLLNHHRAVDDATSCGEIFIKLAKKCIEEGIADIEDLSNRAKSSPELIRKAKSYHIIILAKNEIGRVNLYRLVSESHLKYFQRQPKIPKSLLSKYREGLIIGSACEAGELFRAITEGASDEDIASIVNFYDYLEIQPIGNNEFMIRKGEAEDEEELRNYNRKIVELGEKYNKPVCATCDVHFLDPEDEVYRRIIMAGKGFDDADFQAPLYLRTTEEMLEEFAYLGSDKAEEVVITNTNMIADMVEKISPVRPDKCPPVIENSEQTLTDICYKKAHDIYGENLPQIVVDRLERELKSIIGNGFAVMYIIAQKLVWKSNDDGYLVGSRGSVGSSLVAFLAGITEVNSLSPHYICPECHFTDFDSEEVKKFSGMAGCDMPDRDCPVCGHKLIKDGFDIPFETFLGFKGDKEPDIDLNFSGEYQPNAHKYTEVIFGEGHTFRAGTIGTLADKTAFGYVKNYFEERGSSKRVCEINRIVQGCVGVRRTTGQHPGGIIVLPHGEQIYSFTPIQHPANDNETDIITTHFDYHSIDHNLLKLDILGHDDPTMIRRLQDLIGMDPTGIPLDDKGVMSLFRSTEALGITPEDIGGTKLGTLGIPEFGTDFAMQMLIDTKPQYFSDLVRIAGLAHGTDVWLNNAQTLISEGKATISTAICTRDDIMIYLISKGVDSSHAFSIMENVRKGKVAAGKCDKWAGWKEEMISCGVPDWYIWSCERIKYMFPKAHAAAYVMMAWRIAYCKIYYPLDYYSAYFSIRATAFSYVTMCQGEEKIKYFMNEILSKGDDMTPKDKDSIKDMRIVQEFYARGFEFIPVDIMVADARYFTKIDGKLMPSLQSIDGMGEKAAESLAKAAKNGPFLSKDDLKERTQVSGTVVETMSSLGLLGQIPESNQLSLFDFS